jgi:hypothetical protein
MDMRRAIPVLVALLALIAAACGDGAGEATTTTSTVLATTSAPAPTTTVAPATTTTESPATTTTTPETTTTAPPVTTTGPTGNPVDFGPAEGDVLMVVGVRHDDILNLREGAGTAHDVIEQIPPTADDVVALGQTVELPSSFWILVEYSGHSGWVNMAYVGYQGDTNDDTARIIADLGERPTETSMTALGELIAEQYASDEPEPDIVQVTPVTTGDLSQVTYDVIGLGDDAVRGVRLHVFAERAGGGFSLRTVEVTLICGRGVDDGACV